MTVAGCSDSGAGQDSAVPAPAASVPAAAPPSAGAPAVTAVPSAGVPPASAAASTAPPVSSPAVTTGAPGATGSANGSAPTPDAPSDVTSSPGTTPTATPTTTPGSLATVPARARPTLPPVPVETPASFGGGVRARLAGIDPITVAGQGPGEVDGPGVAVRVELTNGSRRAVSLDSATMSASYDGQEAAAAGNDPAKPLAGRLAPGASTTGVYVFLVPVARTAVTYVLSYAPDQPVVVFTDS